MWAYRFLKHLPEDYKRIKQKSIDPNRIGSEDGSAIQTWFDRLVALIERYSLQAEDLYNSDKVGFIEG
jgi:hypothetical protein